MIHNDTRVIKRTLLGLNKKIDYLIHQGGTSSGKTYGIIYSILSFMLSLKKGENLLFSIVSANFPHLRRGALRDMQNILSECNWWEFVKWQKVNNVFTFHNGSKIEFFTADDEKKARGGKRHFLFVNEANSISYDVFWQMKIRTDYTTIIDYNPSGEFWLHDKVMPSLKINEYLYTKTTYKDNPSVSGKIAKELERLKDVDSVLYQVYALGETGIVQGVIFNNVKYVDSFPSECKKVCYGMDLGFTNDPTTLIKFGVYNGELYGDEIIYETGLTTNDILAYFKDLGINKNIEIFCDNDPRLIKEIRQKGYNIKRATKGSGSIIFGIDLLKRYKINITHNSVNFKKETKNYKWKAKGGDFINTPIDTYNHCWDAYRYAAIMKLKPRLKVKTATV